MVLRLRNVLAYRGFPGKRACGSRTFVYKYSEGKRVSGVKRVKSKGRGVSYIYFSLFMFIVIWTTAEGTDAEHIPYRKAEPEDIWEMMFRLLTPEQRKQADRDGLR